MKKAIAEFLWENYIKSEVGYKAKDTAEQETRKMINDLVETIIRSGEYQLNRERWSFLNNHSAKHDLADAFQRSVDRRIDDIFKQYEKGIKKKIQEYIASEEFIDSIIERINKKQLER